MARIDKYEPVGGGFRAPWAADFAGSDVPVGIGLDNAGRVVVGGGNTGVVAVVCKPDKAKAGDIADCMTDGEIVEFAGLPGTVYTSSAAGVIDDTAPGAGQTRIGHTVEGTRLIVRVAR
jgi:hypothetical protein